MLQAKREVEAILAEARREGEALIEKARVQAETENRQAKAALKASEANHAKAVENSKIHPTGSHWGLGCLTILAVAIPIVFLGFVGTQPGFAFSLSVFVGWILFAYVYAWLATESRLRASGNTVSEEATAAEQTRLEQEKVQQQAGLAADNLLAKARSRSQAEFAERLSVLQDDLRQTEGRVSQAESVLSTFMALK